MTDEVFRPWLDERNIDDVEAFVPDMAGAARGKVLPADNNASTRMRSILGDEFVTLYAALKEAEYMEFQEIITPWEREILMFNV